MRIWTIQPSLVWATLRLKRVVHVSVDALNNGDFIPEAYRWIQTQMAIRLADYQGHLPWWAYCEKPDLRQHRHTRPKGTSHVRLELEIADHFILSFPCWAWHFVFCGDYLACSETEYHQWTSRVRQAVLDEDTWPPPEPWHSDLQASWESLFSDELPLLDWNHERPGARRLMRECIFESLRLEDVRDVTRFTGTLELSRYGSYAALDNEGATPTRGAG